MSIEVKVSVFYLGESAYGSYYGYPAVKPEPNIHPLDIQKRLYAVKFVLPYLRTYGGLKTYKLHGALHQNGMPIKDLYVIGGSAADDINTGLG